MEQAPPSFTLQYSAVEALLAELHAISPTGRTALRARLKHLKRLGFPDGVNTGSGRPAGYGIGPLLSLLIAFDLLQLGLTPERAIGLLRSDGYVVVQAAGFCSRHLTRERTVDDKDDFYLAFDPTVLADLSNPGSSGELDDPVLRKVLCGASAYVLSEVGKGGRRWVILNLTHLIWEAAVRLELTGVTTIAAFADALLAWAASFDWRVADGIDPEA